MPLKPVSVSQLNSYIKRILATDPILMNISVAGEISGLTRHSSGHWYFSLKDEMSTVRCFLPRERVSSLRFEISEGMEVVLYGSLSVYERGGTYSVYVRDLDVMGEGALKQAFENLKKKLAAEGIFDEAHKKPLPPFPRRIGVVTSPTGAAVHDIITTVRRRNPLVSVLVYPCLVQGPDAAKSIAEAIADINRRFPDLDLIIAGRGGGSAEDLWCFNEEVVARSIYASAIPVISAVGHEVDFTIADLAADLRGATPTAAAELAVPHMGPLLDTLEMHRPQRLYGYLQAGLDTRQLRADHAKDAAESAARGILTAAESRLALLKSDIELSDPRNVLKKGYAMVKDGERWIIKAAELSPGQEAELIFADGNVRVRIEEVKTHGGTRHRRHELRAGAQGSRRGGGEPALRQAFSGGQHEGLR